MLAFLGVTLAVAALWIACATLVDQRGILASSEPGVFVPQKGFVHRTVSHRRARWSAFGACCAVAVGGLSASTQATGPTAARLAAIMVGMIAVGILVWLQVEQWLHRRRATLLCVSVHAGIVAVLAAAWAAPGVVATLTVRAAVPVGAGVFLAQMYLVSAIRKLRSRPFTSGQVVFDLLLFGAIQRRAGSQEFPSFAPAKCLVSDPILGQRAASAASWSALIAEVLLAGGALRLLPTVVILPLAVLTHGAFAALAPRRVLPFSISAVALLTAATAS